MSNRNGLIKKPINVLSDVGYVLGTGSGDVGTNCTSNNITIFSKYKPNSLEGYTPPAGSDPDISPNQNDVFITNGYGLDALGATSISGVKSAVTTGWRYRGPNFRSGTKYYRILDFNGYYHNAPCPFEQINGNSITIDLVNESNNANQAISFYILLKDGYNANQDNKVPATYGSYNYMNSCLTVQDNIFTTDLQGSGHENLIGGHAGVILYDDWANNSILTSKFSTSQNSTIAVTSERYDDIHNLSLLDLYDGNNVTVGSYTAVACIKKDNNYYPAYSTTLNPNPFTIKLSGVDYYPATLIGIADSSSDTPATSITGIDDDYYITYSLKNNWTGNFSVQPTGTPSVSSKFYLKYTIRIKRPGETEWTYFDSRNQIWSSQSAINLNSGQSGTLTFKIEKVWQSDPTIGGPGGVVVDSGTIIKISTSLWFGVPPVGSSINDERRYDKTIQPELTVTHI